MKYLVIFCTCFLVSGLTNAYTSTSGTVVNISSLRTYNSNMVLFKAASANNNDNCNGPEGWIQLTIDPSNEAAKRQYSVLLSARVSNTPLLLFFNGCGGGGTSGWRVLDQILM